MKIIVAKTAGFCMGVSRAVEMALDAANVEGGNIYTYGPLIHNPQVLDLLKEKGVKPITKIPNKGRGTVIIRAHGVPPEARTALEKAGFNVIDATCPRVIRVQTIIRKHTEKGYETIIIGNHDHPEVIGLMGFSYNKGHVVNTISDLNALPKYEKAIIVAQTTQNTNFFTDVKAWAAENAPHYKVFDTICDSTERRQNEVMEMARKVDAFLVVGGQTSGNTKRLAEIAEESGKPAFHVESEKEIENLDLEKFKTIAITAGASTPNWVLNKVKKTIEATSMKGKNSALTVFLNIRKLLLLTNIYVAAGAFFLCIAATRLQKLDPNIYYSMIAFLYVLSMHIINHLTGRKADRYNDPERSAFYDKHRLPLAILSVLSGASGLYISYMVGLAPFLLLLFMSITGLMYNITLIPSNFKFINYRRIRDVPGSKTLLIALAWGIVTSLFAPISEKGKIDAAAVIVFLWSAGIVFVRTAFFDILDIQGDRIVGKNTIPILIGEKKAQKLLKKVLIMLFFIPPAACAAGYLSPLAFLLGLSPALIYIILSAHESGYMTPGLGLEFLIETQFVLAGLMTILTFYI